MINLRPPEVSPVSQGEQTQTYPGGGGPPGGPPGVSTVSSENHPMWGCLMCSLNRMSLSGHLATSGPTIYGLGELSMACGDKTSNTTEADFGRNLLRGIGGPTGLLNLLPRRKFYVPPTSH